MAILNTIDKNNLASLTITSEDDIQTLPVFGHNPNVIPIDGHDVFSIGSQAICPSTGNVFMLTLYGWLKL